MHWLTEPATSAPRGDAHLGAGLQGPARDPGRAQLRLAHRSGADGATRSTASTSARTGSASAQDVDYDDTLASVHRTVEGYPGLYRDVQTYLRERIKEVLTGTSESIVVRIFGPDLRGPAREGGGDRGEDREDRRRHRRASRLLGGPAAHRGRARPRRGAAVRPQAGRRPPAVLDAARQRGGQRHLLRRQGLRRARVEHPVGAQQRDRRGGAADRHARRGDRVRLEQVADVRLAPTPNNIEREQQSRRIDVGANVEGRDLGLRRRATSRSALEGVEVPGRVPRRGAGRVHRAERRPGPPAHVRHRRPRSRSSCCCRRPSAACAWRR